VIKAKKQNHSKEHSQQLGVSLFEQSTLLLFNALFYVITQNLNKSAQTLWTLHTNLE
jgi:6-phospho-3-hexuloisomerase